MCLAAYVYYICVLLYTYKHDWWGLYIYLAVYLYIIHVYYTCIYQDSQQPTARHPTNKHSFVRHDLIRKKAPDCSVSSSKMDIYIFLLAYISAHISKREFKSPSKMAIYIFLQICISTHISIHLHFYTYFYSPILLHTFLNVSSRVPPKWISIYFYSSTFLHIFLFIYISTYIFTHLHFYTHFQTWVQESPKNGYL